MRLARTFAFVALGLAGLSAAACRESSAPHSDAERLASRYRAGAIDGQELPVALPLMGRPVDITSAELEFLSAGLFSWRLLIRDAESAVEEERRVIGFWFWAAKDSIVLRLSGDQPIEGFGSLRGDELRVVIAHVADAEVGLPFYLGGDHEWDFVRAP